MGVLCDLILADVTEASALASALPSDQRWRRWDCKGLDAVELGKLDAILRRGEYEPSFVSTCQEVAAGGDDGPWVFRVPSETAARIAAIADADAQDIALAWAATPEFKWFKPAPIVAMQYLDALREASLLSEQSNLSVLMWMSL